MPTNSPDQALALIRLNIADVSQDEDKRLLSDEQLTTLFDHYDGNTNRASARALRIIATSEVLVSKKIRTQELSSDGPAVAEALLKLADVYDAEADEVDAGDAGGLFIVPFSDAEDRLETEEPRRWY